MVNIVNNFQAIPQVELPYSDVDCKSLVRLHERATLARLEVSIQQSAYSLQHTACMYHISSEQPACSVRYAA
jgi:hypothetical protein